MSRSTDSFRLAAAVLAAGSSSRFGEADKLAEDFRGVKLGLHAVRAIPNEMITAAFVISAKADHPCTQGWLDAGFRAEINPDAAQGMGSSVALAARLAGEARADALLIALADMPLVPRHHFQALAKAGVRGHSDLILASSNGENRSPPAIFGCDHFDRLAALEGDAGARDLLAEGAAVVCPGEWLIDIDTPEALAALQSR